MPEGRAPGASLVCPICRGDLAPWSRPHLVVDFCRECEALFLDRGELYQMLRIVGYRSPPEAFLRARFAPHAGETLVCARCEQNTLVPGTVEGVEVWHCTPCNGFLVEGTMLFGPECGEDQMEASGFSRIGIRTARGAKQGQRSLRRLARRIAFWRSEKNPAPE